MTQKIRRKGQRQILLSAFFIVSVCVTTSQAQLTSGWSTYFHDAQHTGSISGLGPSVPVSSWTVAIGAIVSPASISTNNVAYVSGGNNLNAISPNGSFTPIGELGDAQRFSLTARF